MTANPGRFPHSFTLGLRTCEADISFSIIPHIMNATSLNRCAGPEPPEQM